MTGISEERAGTIQEALAHLSLEKRSSTRTRYMALAALLLAFGILIAAGITAYLHMLRLYNSRSLVVQTYDALGSIDGIEDTLQIVEAQQREYLLTDQESGMVRFEQEINQMPRLIAGAKTFVSEDVRQLELLSKVEQLIQFELSELKASIALHKRIGREAAPKAILSRQDSANMGHIQELLRLLKDREEQVLIERTVTASKNADEALTRLAALAGLAVVVLLFTALSIERLMKSSMENQITLLVQYISSKILAESATESEAIKQILSLICETLGMAAAAIWTMDRQASVLRCKHFYSGPGTPLPRLESISRTMVISPKIGLCGRVWDSGEALWISDVMRDPDFPRKPYAAEDGIHTAFAAPIISGTKSIGVLEVFDREVRKPNAKVLRLISSLGVQLGLFFETKQAQHALARGEERYNLAIEGSQDGIYDWDLKSGTNYYSPLCFQQLGYEPGEFDTNDRVVLYSLVHPEDQKRVRMAVRSHLRRKTPFDAELRARTKDGGYKWIHVRGQAFWDENGKPQRFVGSHRDIAERIESQEQLKQSEKRFRQMADNIKEVFFVTDPRGHNPVFVSPAYEEIFGRSVESLFASPAQFFEVTHPDDRKALAALIRRQRQTKQSCQLEYRIYRPDGEIRWLWARLSAILDEKGALTGICGVTSDVTERKEVEKRVSEFYSMVSHELRTPLTSIRGSFGLIEGGQAGKISPMAAQLVAIGRMESDRLIRLINDILDIKKIESGGFELKKASTNSEEIVTKTLEGISSMALEAKVRLKSVLSSNRQIEGDLDKLIQVLTNLISNAIKYSSADGTVTITTENVNVDTIRFAVKDEGPGIKEEDLHKLFGMFQQIDQSDSRPKGGTGLGLAISKAIVEQHGGKIGVNTKSGHGCTFWFELPADKMAGTVSEKEVPTKVIEASI
jgi:PAS domain S-box-containing protein